MLNHSRKCNVCGERENIKFHFAKNNYKFYLCNMCGLEFIYPLPSNDELDKFYSKAYYNEDKQRYYPEKENNPQSYLNTRRGWLRRLGLIRRFIDVGSILDIGCATGVFLQIAREEGWNVFGIEKFPIAAKEAQEKLGRENIYIGDPLDYQTDKKYDVITMWGVIEHLKDPHRYIKKINGLLKVNGLLVLSTPNTNSLNRKLFWKKWRYFIPPEHLFYFNANNLSMLLAKGSFEILRRETFFSNVAFLQGINIDLNSESNFTKIIKKLILFSLKPVGLIADQIALGDTIEIIAKKDRNIRGENHE